MKSFKDMSLTEKKIKSIKDILFGDPDAIVEVDDIKKCDLNDYRNAFDKKNYQIKETFYQKSSEEISFEYIRMHISRRGQNA